jgi:AcrR family transcriptional regulator
MSEKATGETPRPRARNRRSDGERSRKAILHAAAQLATVEGINGLSISRLAAAVGMSKSGLFAHFGSKEELQLATVEFASAVFSAQVTGPAADAPDGMQRLRSLSENFLQHVEGGVYPGGCFFASTTAELDTQSGPVRDRVLEVESDFLARLDSAARQAQADGDIDPSEDLEQLVFELHAFMLLANALFVLTQSSVPIARARRAIERRLPVAPALFRP